MLQSANNNTSNNNTNYKNNNNNDSLIYGKKNSPPSMTSTSANATSTTANNQTITTLSHHLNSMTTTNTLNQSMATNSSTLNNLLYYVPQTSSAAKQSQQPPVSSYSQQNYKHTIADSIDVNSIPNSLINNHVVDPINYQHYQYNQLEQCQAPIVQRSPIIGGFGSDPTGSGGNCSIVGSQLATDSLGTFSGASNSLGDDKFLEIFNPEKLNFSDHQMVWIRKDWLDILIRVSFVAPIVLLGIIGNLTIIYSMCKFKKFRLKPTNIFILNMAIADLLTTMVCPISALFTDIYQFYVLGSFLCRFEGFVKSEL